LLFSSLWQPASLFWLALKCLFTSTWFATSWSLWHLSSLLVIPDRHYILLEFSKLLKNHPKCWIYLLPDF
jgi:hypothetical protein